MVGWGRGGEGGRRGKSYAQILWKKKKVTVFGEEVFRRGAAVVRGGEGEPREGGGGLRVIGFL